MFHHTCTNHAETSYGIFFAQMTSGLSSMKYTYSLVRMVATMALACCFIMLDAQTIQVRGFILSHLSDKVNRRQKNFPTIFIWALSRGGHRHLQIGRMLDIDLISEPPHAPSPQMYESRVWEYVWPEGQEAIHS
jgi:hypothetical protein